jgi:hypothetical protein
MALGALAIALSSATECEHSSWTDAAHREGERYGIDREYVRAGLQGREHTEGREQRTGLDWALVGSTTAIFIGLAVMAKMPTGNINSMWAAVLAMAMLVLLATCGIALWRTTRFR